MNVDQLTVVMLSILVFELVFFGRILLFVSVRDWIRDRKRGD